MRRIICNASVNPMDFAVAQHSLLISLLRAGSLSFVLLKGVSDHLTNIYHIASHVHSVTKFHGLDYLEGVTMNHEDLLGNHITEWSLRANNRVVVVVCVYQWITYIN